MRQSAVFLGFLLLVAGCVYQQGHRFDANAVRQLQPRVSTEQDAITQLGVPAARSNYADGTQLLQWQYVYGTTTGAGGNAHAAILFGPDHKMIRVVELFQQ
jgi:outer membrane protein assembly factor BamE (lipoprotein component of BamABCDE complex)